MAFDLLIELDEDLLAFEKRLEFEFLVGVGEDVMERLHLGQLRIFGLVAVALQFGDHLVQKGQISLHVRPLSIVLVHHDYFEATPDQRLQWEGALGAALLGVAAGLRFTAVQPHKQRISCARPSRPKRAPFQRGCS